MIDPADKQWFRIDAASHTVTLTIHAQPGARHTAIAGLHGGALKIRVAAPATENRANVALISFIAELFAVPVKQVRLLHGGSARHKIVEVMGSERHPDSLLQSLR